ncbi:MAG TPA: YceI family protein [Mucilaginibacter sp.]|jgi:polyisoprenoid-binding protein YceI|nr:YceI family protein [Mucilaginibacter sp.]
MKKLFVFTAIVLMHCASGLKAQSQAIHSAVTFEIKNLGIAMGGSLGGLQAKVHFTPADLNASTIEASVDVNTLNTDNASRDEHLRSEDFFDAAHFSKISLKSVNFKHKSGSNYTGMFILTMKGRSKQIEIPFAFLDKEGTVEFKGTFKINRLDFGVGSKSMILSDDVTVTIDCGEKKQMLTRI